MSKMGQELERRLDENKYELYKACKAIMAGWDNVGDFDDDATSHLNSAISLVDKVLVKIEGKQQ